MIYRERLFGRMKSGYKGKRGEGADGPADEKNSEYLCSVLLAYVGDISVGIAN